MKDILPIKKAVSDQKLKKIVKSI